MMLYIYFIIIKINFFKVFLVYSYARMVVSSGYEMSKRKKKIKMIGMCWKLLKLGRLIEGNNTINALIKLFKKRKNTLTQKCACHVIDPNTNILLNSH